MKIQMEFKASLGKSGLIKIPKTIIQQFGIEDACFYPIEVNISGESERIRLVLRCSSGHELYFPKPLQRIYKDKMLRLKYFNKPINTKLQVNSGGH